MIKYDSYKDSGVEWIGEIPIEWDVTRLKFTGDLFGGLTGKKGDDFNQDNNPNNKPYIPYTNIFNNTYISKNHFHYVVLRDGEKQNRVEKFDMFFLMSSETHQDLGKSCILIDDVDELYLNSFCKGLRVTNIGLNPLFLNYQLLGQVHKELISVEGRGFTRINLRQSRLKDTPIFIPPFQEQQQIVEFLDSKTSMVDSVIRKTQMRIEFLKEKRTSLINYSVTKGLNPNVEMKDSGVEWIGEIPSHWENRNGTTIGLYSKGKGIKKDEVKKSGNPCVRYGEIYTKYNHIVKNVTTFIDDKTTETSISINTDSLLLTGSGETKEEIGKCIVYTGSDVLWIGGDIIIIKPKNDLYSVFLSYLINSECIRVQREMSGKGEIIVHIYSKNFKEMRYPIPPLSEQQQIVEYLDEQTNIIDTTISKEQKRIKLLKEYRQSLISEVVTGKIKVTNE